MAERLQKILSQWGIASRRQAEQMILDGRVRLNGEIAPLGAKADPACDRLEVDGLVVKSQHRPDHLYLLLNKPLGYLSTCYDPQGRRTVLHLLPSHWQQGQGIHPVGRLDCDSTGALLLTNDGELTHTLSHPRHHIDKTYHVWVAGRPDAATLDQWRQGICLDHRQTLPAQVRILKHGPDGTTLLAVILQEGRNRQIRRVAEQLGHPVQSLHRVAIGPICLSPRGQPSLPSGAYRLLTPDEVHTLQSSLNHFSRRPPAPAHY
jgi:23S rRNA pseudouridine2605 synthase